MVRCGGTLPRLGFGIDSTGDALISLDSRACFIILGRVWFLSAAWSDNTRLVEGTTGNGTSVSRAWVTISLVKTTLITHCQLHATGITRTLQIADAFRFRPASVRYFAQQTSIGGRKPKWANARELWQFTLS
jgi:hypothetical protein